MKTTLCSLDLPETGPRILGLRPSYVVGDTLTAQCVSPVSSPPSDLTWYINHHAADRRLVSNQTRTGLTLNQPPRDWRSEEIVMEPSLRSPLKFDFSGQPEPDRERGETRPDLYSLGLRLTVRDSLVRDNGG